MLGLHRFGKLFKTKQGFYFYDTGTSKVIKMDEKAYLLFSKIIDDENVIDFISMNETERDSLVELLDAIEKNSLLRAFELNKLGNILHDERLEEQLNGNVNQIILEVTGKCNLRCRYCIYNESYDENRGFNDKVMNAETAYKAVDYLNEHGRNEVAVTFYGGEPLLQYELVKNVILYSQERIKDKKLSYSLTTNLTLMTKEKADFLASIEGMSIVCSLDGPEDVHNAYRVFQGGTGSYDKAIQGLKILLESFGNKAASSISINAVFAPPYTYEKLIEINSFFTECEWIPDNLRIEITYAAEGSVDDKECIRALKKDDSYLTEQNTFNPLYLWSKNEFMKGQTGGITQSGISNMLIRIHKRNIYSEPVEIYPFNACCVPGVRRIYVNTDGEFFVCERIGNSPSIGNVTQGIDVEAVRRHYVKDYSDASSENCKNCWAIRLCDRCYVGNYSNTGYKNDNLNKSCDEMRDYVERELFLYHEILERDPQKLAYLNEIIVS